ncbi:MAG: SMC-Scp complex subunit ScpB [Clostridia bacterium]|nr:SMC-Scp complex subunit ScpB [Clostridia bacterium]
MKTLANIIESLLFVSGDAVAIKDIAEKSNVSDKDVLNAAKELQEKYGEDSGINLLIFNKKLQFCSNPKYADEVSNVLNPIKMRELSRSMLEVVAIIAYKQPVTRIDLEELRGSNSEFALQNLLKLGIIEVVGRKDTVGKPVLFGTTDEFLKRFQISSLNDLPDYNELLDRIAKLRSPSSDSSYLFEKDTYVENDEEQPSLLDGLNNPIPDVTESAITESDDDFELGDIEGEELPDFLQGENFEVIK